MTKQKIFLLKNLLFICTTLFFLQKTAHTAHAQISTAVGSTEKDFTELLYNKEFTTGAHLHTNGWGVGIQFIKINSIFKRRVIEYSFSTLKHPREHRAKSDLAQNSFQGYVFGKQNALYTLNATIGNLKTIAQKAKKTGIAVSYYYAGGVTLGLLKPYYLNLFVESEYPGLGYAEAQQYEAGKNDSIFLDPTKIISRASPLKGLIQMKPRIGLTAKIATHFDFSTESDAIKAIEVGAVTQIFPTQMPIMVTEDNPFLFTNLYVKLMLGKRK